MRLSHSATFAFRQAQICKPGQGPSRCFKRTIRCHRVLLQSSLLSCTLALTSCSTPDLSPGIEDAAGLLSKSDSQIRPALVPLAKAELSAAEDAALRAGRPIIGLSGLCEFPDQSNELPIASDCQLDEYARPDSGPVNATTTLDALGTMSAYFTALAALASSDSSNEIKLRADALMDAIAQIGTGNGSTALDRIAAKAAAQKDLVSGSTGLLAAQYRIAALRRVARAADPLIGQITLLAIAYLDQQPGSRQDIQRQLEDANARVAAARKSGNPAEHASAAADLRKAFAAFQRAETTAPANQLLLVRRYHSNLLASLTGPQSPEDVLTIAEEIKAIASLATTGD